MKEEKNLFKVFSSIADYFTYDLIEIAIKPRQTVLIFNGAYLMDKDLKQLLDITKGANQGFLYSEENIMHYALDYNEDETIPKISQPFINVLKEISEKVCACPILEFVVSDKYIKMYLDKRDLTVDDLTKYEEIFGFPNEGTLMLHTQRPYLLFVNTEYDLKGEEND